MAQWSPEREHARVSVHLTGEITEVKPGSTEWFPMTILTLSEVGFYCEGIELDRLEAPFRVRLALDEIGPTWSPKQGAASWRAAEATTNWWKLDVQADLLYMDLSHDGPAGPKVGIGARFHELREVERSHLHHFLSHELLRSRACNVPAPPTPPMLARHGRTRF